MAISRHQALGAYQRWDFPSFDRPTPPETPVAETPPPVEAPPIDPPAPEPIEPDLPEDENEAPIQLPTAEDIERIHEESRKEGYAAGYEEGTARGRIEAMHFHGLVQGMEAALTALDREVADEILALSIEIARQLARQTLAARPETVVELIREALVQMPQTHALIHIHPDDAAMAREYLGEQLAHSGHRLVEDVGIERGGVRIDAAGSQVDATVQTRWRRIMENLGRTVSWDGEG